MQVFNLLAVDSQPGLHVVGQKVPVERAVVAVSQHLVRAVVAGDNHKAVVVADVEHVKRVGLGTCSAGLDVGDTQLAGGLSRAAGNGLLNEVGGNLSGGGRAYILGLHIHRCQGDGGTQCQP